MKAKRMPKTAPNSVEVCVRCVGMGHVNGMECGKCGGSGLVSLVKVRMANKEGAA